MKISQAGNKILPNTFQHPNIFIDRLMYYLTPEENVVLTFAVRRILGFQENISSRKDRISLSQFTDGIISSKGEYLSLGCGLGLQGVRAALEILLHANILLPTDEKPGPKGQEYWLQDNENNINWVWLEKRKEEKSTEHKNRTQKATEKSLEKRGYVGRKGYVGRNDSLTSHVTEGVTSDVNTKPTETHRNPQEKEEEEEEVTFAASWTFYQNNINPTPTQYEAEAFGELTDLHSPRWVLEASKIAVKRSARSLAYITRILERWKQQGYGTPCPSKDGYKSKESPPPPKIPIVKAPESETPVIPLEKLQAARKELLGEK